MKKAWEESTEAAIVRAVPALPENLTIGIVGAGLMGRGIAQIAAQAGITTLLFDVNDSAASAAKEAIMSTLNKLATKGKFSVEQVTEVMQRIQPVDTLQAFASCHLVVEAVVENLSVKRELFKALESIVSADCLLATNTSSLSITAIAAACARPARVAGFHFFSPVPLMKLVEVIEGVRTAPGIAEWLIALAVRMGHTPVRAQDTPGFIVNHAGRGYGTEALRILSEGVAPFHVIDRILRDGAGFRMGPFELLDLTGLDVSQPVMESIYHQYYEEPRFRPTPQLLQRKEAGLLGRKTGEGFYQYVEGVQQPINPTPAPKTLPASVWISNRYPELHSRVMSCVEAAGVPIETGQQPSAEALCIVTPLGEDATTTALAETLDPTCTVAVDALFGLTTHRTLMTTPVTLPAMREAAMGLFAGDGVGVSVVRDSAGLVAQRVIAHIINIACDMAQQRIATPDDIDRAVTLGLGYRQGPLAMGDQIGALHIFNILKAMYASCGDPRYRPSVWLKRRADLGISLLKIEE